MIRLAFCLLIIFGVQAMAKDGTVQAPRGNAQIDEEEAFWQSEMGRDVDRLFNEFVSGKKSYDKAYDEFNAKWADKLNNNQVQRPPTQVPNAPFMPVK